MLEFIYLLRFFPTILFRSAGIRTHVSGLEPLKDVLTTELQDCCKVHDSISNPQPNCQNRNFCFSLFPSKGTIPTNPLMGEQERKKFNLLLKLFESAVYCTPWRQLCDWISQQNWIIIWKHFSLFIRGPWKKTGGRKSRDTLTLSCSK